MTEKEHQQADDLHRAMEEYAGNLERHFSTLLLNPKGFEVSTEYMFQEFIDKETPTMRETAAIRSQVDLRRVKNIRVSHDEMMQALWGWRHLRYVAVPEQSEIPHGCTIVAAHTEPMWNGFMLTVYHPDFPINEGFQIEELDKHVTFKAIGVYLHPSQDPHLKEQIVAVSAGSSPPGCEADYYKATCPNGMWMRMAFNTFASLKGRARQLISRADDRTGCKRHDEYMHIYLTHEEAMEYGSMTTSELTGDQGEPPGFVFMSNKTEEPGDDGLPDPQLPPETSTPDVEWDETKPVFKLEKPDPVFTLPAGFPMKGPDLDTKAIEEAARKRCEEIEKQVLGICANLGVPPRVFIGPKQETSVEPGKTTDKLPPGVTATRDAEGNRTYIGNLQPGDFDLWGAAPKKLNTVKPQGEPMRVVKEAAEGIEPLYQPAYSRIVPPVDPKVTEAINELDEIHNKAVTEVREEAQPVFGVPRMKTVIEKIQALRKEMKNREATGTEVAEVRPIEGWGATPVIWKESKIDPYSSCPCGSGRKFKWCCLPKQYKEMTNKEYAALAADTKELLCPKCGKAHPEVECPPRTLVVIDEATGADPDLFDKMSQWSEKTVIVDTTKPENKFYRTKEPRKLLTVPDATLTLTYDANILAALTEPVPLHDERGNVVGTFTPKTGHAEISIRTDSPEGKRIIEKLQGYRPPMLSFIPYNPRKGKAIQTGIMPLEMDITLTSDKHETPINVKLTKPVNSAVEVAAVSVDKPEILPADVKVIPEHRECSQCGWKPVKDTCPVCGATSSRQIDSLLPPELR